MAISRLGCHPEIWSESKEELSATRPPAIRSAVRIKFNRFARRGEMAEWLKAHAWKACLLERVTWVRIPLSPPYH